MTDDTAKQEIGNMRARMHELNNLAQSLVTRDATMALQVGNLVELVTEHKNESKAFMGETRQTLTAISKQTTETNGRVNGHDEHFVMNDREIRDIKDTLGKVLWLFLGLNVTVIGGVIVYWVTHQ